MLLFVISQSNIIFKRVVKCIFLHCFKLCSNLFLHEKGTRSSLFSLGNPYANVINRLYPLFVISQSNPIQSNPIQSNPIFKCVVKCIFLHCYKLCFNKNFARKRSKQLFIFLGKPLHPCNQYVIPSFLVGG